MRSGKKFWLLASVKSISMESGDFGSENTYEYGDDLGHGCCGRCEHG